MPAVSVVIPLWKGRSHIPACLEALQQQTLRDFEVIVVDNASPDGAGDWVAKEHPDVVLLRLPVNRGFAGGTNAGLRAARGKHLVTLNQDAVADPRFLEELVATVEAAPPRTGMVASKMRYFHDRDLINSTGIQLLGDGYAEDRGCFEPDEGQWDAPGEVFGPCAGAALYTRALLDEVGLFDEDFFCYFEDTDLAWRARIAGWTCAYQPRAIVFHKHRGSEEQLTRAHRSPEHVMAWCERNRLWMLAKNASITTLLLRAPILLGREVVSLVEVARRGETYRLRARLEAAEKLQAMLDRRREIQARRRVPDREIRKWMRRMPLIARKEPAPPPPVPAPDLGDSASFRG